jgi:hypothetical protein
MKCVVDLKKTPTTLTILPQYLTKEEAETINRVGHNGMITLFTLDSALDDCLSDEGALDK